MVLSSKFSSNVHDIDLIDDLFRINTLAMIRLKQEELKNIKSLNMYSPMQLNYFGMNEMMNFSK